jgi:hypothetical protein
VPSCVGNRDPRGCEPEHDDQVVLPDLTQIVAWTVQLLQPVFQRHVDCRKPAGRVRNNRDRTYHDRDDNCGNERAFHRASFDCRAG